MRNKSMKATASLLVGGDEICGVLVCSARGEHQQLIIMHCQNGGITNTPLYNNEQGTMYMGQSSIISNLGAAALPPCIDHEENNRHLAGTMLGATV